MDIVESCQNSSNSKTTLEILRTSDTELRLPDLLVLMFQTTYVSLQEKKIKLNFIMHLSLGYDFQCRS